MKAVMLSIRPKWCELIANGKKTVEIRKTKPKLETPFKCYIYCTLQGSNDFFKENLNGDIAKWNKGNWGKLKGKVIGEFVCDNISETFVVCDVHDELPSRPCEYWLEWESDIDDVPKEACLSAKEIMSYLGKQYNGFVWHISDLVIYDKPKELSKFAAVCEGLKPYQCDKCEYSYTESNESVGTYHECCCNNLKPLKRPPQSWCYVEEVR